VVIFKPNKLIRKAYPTINWDTLSLVYSAILDPVYKAKKKRNFVIRIRGVKRGTWNWYSYNSDGAYFVIALKLRIGQFHRVIIHEFRHFIQDKILHVPMTADYEKLYYRHPLEIDARYFENKGLHFARRLYNRINKQKKIFAILNEYRPKGTETNRNGNTSRSKLRSKRKGSK